MSSTGFFSEIQLEDIALQEKSQKAIKRDRSERSQNLMPDGQELVGGICSQTNFCHQSI